MSAIFMNDPRSPRKSASNYPKGQVALWRVGVVLRKELIDNLRDRRSMLSALLTPLILPAFMLALIVVVGRSVLVGPVEKPLILAVQGAENGPGLVDFLRQNGVTIEDAPANPNAEVRLGRLDVVLVIPADYAGSFAKGVPAPVQMIVDSSRQSSAVTISRVRGLLDGFNRQIASMRLLARGIDPSVIAPLAVESSDVATPQNQGLIFLNMMPFLIVVVLFMGGMYVAIDTTAGERERGSLEALLINPTTREEFVLGKLLASLPFAVAALVISLAAFWAVFDVFPLEQYTGFPVTLEASTLGSIFWISLPMILFASGLQIVVASFTHSFKEAQTYLAFLPLAAGLPGAFLAFLPVRATVWTMLIPAFSQSILINAAMRGDPADALQGLLSAAATLECSLVLVWVAVRLYRSERILFGR